MVADGARVRGALRLRGSPSVNPSGRSFSCRGRRTAWTLLHRPPQPWPGSPQRRAGRSPGRGLGRREPSLRQSQTRRRRWDPVARAPPPRPGFALGHAPSSGPASVLPETALKALLLPLKISPSSCLPLHSMVPHRQVSGLILPNLPFCHVQDLFLVLQSFFFPEAFPLVPEFP